jgi:hypothetical protein
MAAALGYDCVKIRQEDGVMRMLSRPQYEALPLAQRISMVLKNTVEFYRAGTRITSVDALKLS